MAADRRRHRLSHPATPIEPSSGPRRLRLLLVGEQLRRRVPGGIGTYIRSLAHALERLGERAPLLTLWTSRLPAPVLVRAWDAGLGRLPAEADVVHAPSLAVPPGRGRPLSVMVHDLAWRHHPDAFTARGRRWHEAALGRARKRARLLLTPSRGTADDLLAAGAPSDRIEVVEEGADHLPAPDHAGADALLAQLSVRGDFLLSVSTLEPRKNLGRLVAAYASARDRLPGPWPLVLVGPQGWGSAVPEVAPPGGVHLAGRVDDAVLSALYQRARTVAYVPLREGFGLPAVEAMRAGAPVVASPMPSTGGAALEVDPLDVAAIADALVRASTDEALRSELVAAGTRRAAGLTWEAAARRHLELWEGMA